MTAGRGVPRWVVAVSIAGTVLVACGAFWLSFTTLRDLAVRSGVDSRQAWVWPLIVDGVIVVATVSAVALDGAGRGSRRYAWLLLGAGAAISVCANALHAVLRADVGVPIAVAATVASVPPVVLLAITHLTVLLARSGPATDRPTPARQYLSQPAPLGIARRPAGLAAAGATPEALPAVPSVDQHAGGDERRELARRLRGDGLSRQQIADQLGVHRSTVSRWLSRSEPGAHLQDTTDAAQIESHQEEP